MTALVGVGNAAYTPLTANGTSTINSQAPTGQLNTQPGVFYGFNVQAPGTAWVLTALDIVVVVTGTGTTTTTNTICSATAAANTPIPGGVQGIGTRYRGSLVIVTSGTAAGVASALWD